MDIAKVERRTARKSLLKRREQIDAIRHQQTSSLIDIDEFQKKYKRDVSEVDEQGNIVLDPSNREDQLWMDD